MRKLDLGCGFAKVEGAIGLDRAPLENVDVVAQIDTYGLPFTDNSFDEIHLNDIVEHIPDTVRFMEELYRIIRPNGHLYIRVINWNSRFNAMDPTHVRTFDEKTFDFFGTFKGREYYSRARYEVVSVAYQYNWRAVRWIRIKSLLYFLGQYLNNILEGLHFDLKAIKPHVHIPSPADEPTLQQTLRCPSCIEKRKHDQSPDLPLQLNGNWLMCSQQDCQRKYPIHDGLPVILESEAVRWITTPVDRLPAIPPGDFRRIAKPPEVQ